MSLPFPGPLTPLLPHSEEKRYIWSVEQVLLSFRPCQEHTWLPPWVPAVQLSPSWPKVANTAAAVLSSSLHLPSE
jgi:hypothetical protein